MKKEKQHIIDLIYQLDFENAAKHLFQLSKEEQISLMVCEAADTDSIIILGFLSYILSIQNTAFYHQVISEALIQMCWLEGGYNLAFYHACKLLELKPVVFGPIDTILEGTTTVDEWQTQLTDAFVKFHAALK